LKFLIRVLLLGSWLAWGALAQASYTLGNGKNHCMGYDALDNLSASTLGSRNSSHTYDANNRLSTINTNGVYTGYSYDAQGNTTAKGAQGYYFDLGKRLILVSGVASYSYDGLGRRVYAVSSPTATYRTSVYSQGGQLLYTNVQQGTSNTSTRYIYLAGKLIAEDGTAGVVYTHTDALGSPVARSSSTGTLLSNTWYEPYGKTAQGTNPPTIGFTAHVNDADTGLIYMQQRYYEPVSGRFLSVDAANTNPDTGGSFNRYVYGNNNPYKYIDPDGRDNLVAQVGGSLVVGVGVEGYVGMYFSNSPRLDVGIFGSGGLADGLNVGMGASGGAIKGPVSNVAGTTVNVNVSTGTLSTTIINDADSGQPIGATFGGAIRLGASVSVAKTSTFSFRDFLFGKKKPDSESKDTAKSSEDGQKDKKPTPPSPPTPPTPKEPKSVVF